MNTKKIVFWSSIIGGIFALATLYFIYFSPCGLTTFEQQCYQLKHDFFNPISLYLSIFIPLFFLSLITYRLRDEVFTAWWNFARWWVLAIVIITFILNSMSGGGTLGMDRDFTAFTLIILYSILSIGSLVKITRTHVRLRGEEKGLSPVEQDHLKRKTNLYIIAAVVLFIVVLVAVG